MKGKSIKIVELELHAPGNPSKNTMLYLHESLAINAKIERERCKSALGGIGTNNPSIMKLVVYLGATITHCFLRAESKVENSPEENFVDVDAAGSDELAAGVDADAAELDRSRRSEGPEISVPGRVESSDSSVERRRQNDFAVRRVDDATDGGGVLAEGHEAEAGVDAPELELAVLAARRNGRAVCYEEKQH